MSKDNKITKKSRSEATSEVRTEIVELILNDAAYNPVLGTEFKIKIKFSKNGDQVTAYFSAINFQVGQTSTVNPQYPLSYSAPPGGILRTASGFLPPDLCPSETVYQSTLAPSNSANTQAWNFPNLYFTASMAESSYLGYVQATTFSASSTDVGYYLTVDLSTITGPFASTGLPPGTLIFGPNIPAGTYIAGLFSSPNVYIVNNIIPAFPETAGFFTPSVLVIDTILSSSPPLVGVTISGPGIPIGTIVQGGVEGLVNPDGTGLYFTNLVNQEQSTGAPTPVTIDANQNNVLNVTQSIAGGLLTPGTLIYGPGVAPGTVIEAFVTGDGGVGTYIVNIPQIFPPAQIFGLLVSTSQFTIPTVPGFLVSIGPGGDITIQGSGTPFNLIFYGAQTMMPFTMSYLAPGRSVISYNEVLSKGLINVTQWPGGEYGAAGSALRDNQDPDAFNNVIAATWADNSNQSDQSNGVSDAVISVGSVQCKKIVHSCPIQLSNNSGNYNNDNYPYLFGVTSPPATSLPSYIFGTSASINRKNPKNILATWSLGNVPSYPFRAVSWDGGKTWPINGPVNIQPSGGAGGGDNRGARSDMYGNFWYCSSNLQTQYGLQQEQVVWLVSPDGGETFYTAYSTPLSLYLNDAGNDSPTFTFGYDGYGNYGLWFAIDYIIAYGNNNVGETVIPSQGFIPILDTDPCVTNKTTAVFIGSISGTTLTITQFLGAGRPMVGQTLSGTNFDSTNWLDPTTTIVSGSGSTWTVSVPQNVSSTTIYAIVLPIGPLPQVAGASTTVAVDTELLTPSTTSLIDLPVVSTAGFSTFGVILVTNGTLSCTISYGGLIPATPTSPGYFTGCICGFGVGTGILAPAGSAVNQLSTPSFLAGMGYQEYVPSIAAVTNESDPTNGRVWVASNNSLFAEWFFEYGLRFKSSPVSNSSLYGDPISDNWVGAWQIDSQLFSAGSTVGLLSGEISFPFAGYFNSARTIVYDKRTCALYAVVMNRLHVDPRAIPYSGNPNPSLSSQNMTITLHISGDCGMTWGEPIYINSTNFGNRGFQSIALDEITGNLIITWYDGRNTCPKSPTAFQTLEFMIAVVSASRLDKLVAECLVSNPAFQTPSVVENNSVLALAGAQNPQGSATKRFLKKRKHGKIY